MALDIGQDFKQRWLATPVAVRQVYLDDLTRICTLLQPETSSTTWLEQETQHNISSTQRIENAYAAYKAELIQAARLRQQMALEKKLTLKRAAETEKLASLHAEDMQKAQQQLQLLQALQQQNMQELKTYIARYQKNPEQHYSHFNQALSELDPTLLSELDNIRLRLELEAENAIEIKVREFRRQLSLAAHEEIELILKNTLLPDKTA